LCSPTPAGVSQAIGCETSNRRRYVLVCFFHCSNFGPGAVDQTWVSPWLGHKGIFLLVTGNRDGRADLARWIASNPRLQCRGYLSVLSTRVTPGYTQTFSIPVRTTY
jgi:hypothetical protein